jgi:hypothetical protein
MALRGNNDIFRRVELPALTVFEKDFQEWVDIKAKTIVGMVRDYIKRHKLNMEDPALVDRLTKWAIDEASRFEQIVPDEMHMVIAEGSFGAGKRACTVTNAYKFSSLVYSNLWDKVRENNVDEHIKLDELLRKLDETNFEHTLRQYIPAIFKDDWIDWVERFPEEIVEEVYITLFNHKYDAREVAKEIISDEIDEILKQLDKSGSVYVSIVEAASNKYGETTCQIITVAEFVERLYKAAYNSTINFLTRHDY